MPRNTIPAEQQQEAHRQHQGRHALEAGQPLEVLGHDPRLGGDRGQARAHHGEADDVGEQRQAVGALGDVGRPAGARVARADVRVGEAGEQGRDHADEEGEPDRAAHLPGRAADQPVDAGPSIPPRP
jgi:hypothetical protein